MRKIATALPLYVASIILLVFVVLPHHHHEEFICFNNSHCSQPAAATEGDTHEHDPFSEKSGCGSQLFQTEIVKNISSNSSDSENGYHHFTLSLCALAGIFSFQLFAKATDDFLVIRDIPIRHLHLSLHRATRAPPVF